MPPDPTRAALVEAMARALFAADESSLPKYARHRYDHSLSQARARYTNRAEASLTALEIFAKEHGLKLVGSEPTEKMATAGRDEEWRGGKIRAAYLAMHSAARPFPWGEE